jgi:TolB-like protein/class 3 adenylate cyclase/rhodanese-related sulfurtransferase
MGGSAVAKNVQRRLAAILAADVVGYSCLMGEDEAGTLDALQTQREELIAPKIAEHQGRIVKLMGDGLLAEFPSAVEAIHCAVEIQETIAERNAGVPEDRRITYRIGINIGDIIADGDDIYGDGVNVAARLESLAEPGGISISRPVHTQVEGKVDLAFEDLGEQQVKNIAKPVRIFRVLTGARTEGNVAIAATHPKRTLRWPMAAGGVALLVLLTGIALWQRPWEPREEPASVAKMAFPLPDKPSIAILPFNNMSEDRSQEYFADGMTEDLITDLSKISGLFVIARNSSFSYKGQQVKVRQVAEELGVRYVLEGSVRRAGNQVRINAQLIDATTGGHLWAERYDGTLEDVFDLQDRVTEKIVTALAVSLTGEEQAEQTRHGTPNAAAHDAYLQGWARYKLLTPQDLKEAVPFLEEALRLDPDYAQAHAVLATLYWDVLQNDWAFDLGMPSTRAESRAKQHLEEALKNPTPLAHTLQARMLTSWGVFDDSYFDDAVLEAEKAVALDKNDATALAGLAEAMIKADRAAEGLDYVEQAMRLDPHHPPSSLITLGAAQFGMERFEEAAATFERAVKRNPDNELPLIYLASSYGHLGRIKDGDAAIESANDLRASLGMGDLSLERKSTSVSAAFSPFQGEIDFMRFGGKRAQERVRAGLADIPALTWQYLITVHFVLGAGNTWYEVEGATQIDLDTAKAFYDRGAVLVDVSYPDVWKEQRISGAILLNYKRSAESPQTILTEESLMAVAGKADEIVLYSYDPALGHIPARAVAKAVNWGFQKVYFFSGGAPAWKDAGYPVERGQ